MGRDSVEPSNERSEANEVSIPPECGAARCARASFVGSYGLTESRPTVLAAKPGLTRRGKQITLATSPSRDCVMPRTQNKPASTEAQLASEQKAFERQKPQLLRRYEGQFVAFYGGKMVDRDPSDEALALRMYKKFGEVPWWIERVEKKPTIYDFTGFEIIH